MTLPTAEILATGDELVRGLTRDTNGAFIASRLASGGLRVTRLTVLPDDLGAVAAEVRAAAERGADLVVTTGGLGPTTDDRTLEALARATDRPLRTSEEAETMIGRRYRELAEAGAVDDGELTPQRRKMARLPSGARPLPNRVGTAPGMALEADGRLLVALPGVPSELQAMWEGPVTDLLRERFGVGGYAERTFHAAHNDESVLAPLVAEVADRHPGVYVKTRASSFEDGGAVRITLVAGGATDPDADDALARTEDDLRRTLEGAGLGRLADG